MIAASNEKLYHISENPKIKIFEPRISPSHFETIYTDVVFAISEKLVHNYLLPRDCPRVTFYPCSNSSEKDIQNLIGPSCAGHVVAVEKQWIKAIQMTTLFMYEMPANHFSLLDECAGYYVSTDCVEPISVKPVYNILEELMKRDIELRFVPDLQLLANVVKSSTLRFSLIRMKNCCE